MKNENKKSQETNHIISENEGNNENDNVDDKLNLAEYKTGGSFFLNILYDFRYTWLKLSQKAIK